MQGSEGEHPPEVVILTRGVFNHVVMNTNPTMACGDDALAPYKDCLLTGTVTKGTCRCMVDVWLSFAECSKESTYSTQRQSRMRTGPQHILFPTCLPLSVPRAGDICVTAPGRYVTPFL